MEIQKQIDDSREVGNAIKLRDFGHSCGCADELRFKVGQFLVIRVLCVLVLFLLAPNVWPQTADNDLTTKSIEDLMDIEITSVSKKEEKLFQSAAAVYVIRQDEIRRSGMTSIPDLLRTVPGLDVAQIDGSKFAISARGFNGRFANKLLVLIDGRSIYSPETSGVYWEVQDLMLEDVERIEIIRGPGGTLWGANAVNGVINIITKSSTETQGGLATVGSGSHDRGLASIRYGAKLDDKASYRVYGKYFNRSGLITEAGADANDSQRALRGGGRIDWQLSDRDLLTLSGDLFVSNIRETPVGISPIAPFELPRNRPGEFNGGNVTGRWTRAFSERSNMALKFYYDRFSRDIFDLAERINTFDVDFQHNVAVSPKHEVVWGVGYRLVSDSTDSSSSTPVQYHPAKKSVQLFSAFAQDEFTLIRNRLRVTLGAKLEHNDFSGFEAQPNLRLLWTPRNHLTLWGSYSHAVRAAARNDEDLFVNVAAFPGPGGLPTVLTVFGNPNFKSEEVTAYELGYRAQAGKRFSLDVATFYNVYDHLKMTEPGTPFLASDPLPVHLVVPLVYDNLMRGETYGAEASLNLQVTRDWRLAGSYSFLRMNLHRYPESRAADAESAEGISPRHQWQLHSFQKLPHNFELDLSLYHVARLPAIAVPSYTRVDVRLGWRFSDAVELSFAGQNLFDARHTEFGAADGIVSQRVGRSAYGKLTWKF